MFSTPHIHRVMSCVVPIACLLRSFLNICIVYIKDNFVDFRQSSDVYRMLLCHACTSNSLGLAQRSLVSQINGMVDRRGKQMRIHRGRPSQVKSTGRGKYKSFTSRAMLKSTLHGGSSLFCAVFHVDRIIDWSTLTCHQPSATMQGLALFLRSLLLGMFLVFGGKCQILGCMWCKRFITIIGIRSCGESLTKTCKD